MDVNIIRGAILIGLIIGFAGIVIWAWGRKRKSDFEAAARMPLDEDVPAPQSQESKKDEE